MAKYRVDFRIIVEGSTYVDAPEGDCPIADVTSLNDENLLYMLQQEFYSENRPQMVIEEATSECLDHPLIQLAREADDA